MPPPNSKAGGKPPSEDPDWTACPESALLSSSRSGLAARVRSARGDSSQESPELSLRSEGVQKAFEANDNGQPDEPVGSPHGLSPCLVSVPGVARGGREGPEGVRSIAVRREAGVPGPGGSRVK